MESASQGNGRPASSQGTGPQEVLSACLGEISRISNTFGKLVYLASLRDGRSRRYRHYSLPPQAGEEETDRALREAHRRAFSSWLCLSLAHQLADLDLYLSGLEIDRQAVLEVWRRQAPYRELLPHDAVEVERQLFLADLEVLLALMTSEETEEAVPLARARAAVPAT